MGQLYPMFHLTLLCVGRDMGQLYPISHILFMFYLLCIFMYRVLNLGAVHQLRHSILGYSPPPSFINLPHHLYLLTAIIFKKQSLIFFPLGN